MTDVDVFKKIQTDLLKLDPCWFCENYLTLDGKPFRLHGNGYKPFADIYRYIGIKSLEESAKPIIIVKGRQVGGTTMANALEMYFMGSGLFGFGDKSPMRIIHAFPQLEMAAAYSKTKLNPMISSSVSVESDVKNGKVKSYMQSMLDNTTSTNDSLSFKQFQGGNHIWIESVGLNADRLRGRTADAMFFDEMQDTTTDAITNAVKVLTTSKYGPPGKGIQVYFGTPKRKGSDFHKMWMASSQQYFQLGCEVCNKHFPLYSPQSEKWEEIWIRAFTVKCPHCNHYQDKRAAAERGKWVAVRDPDDPECKYVGFHINQLYMPHFTKESVMDEKPGIHPINTERVYQNEVLGEFFQGDSSPITKDDIISFCGDIGRKMAVQISPEENLIVTLGIDYGLKSDLEQLAHPEKFKKTGQSFTSAVVLVSRGSQLSVEFCTKFARNDIQSKKELIEQICRKYSVNLTIGDIGFSQDFSTLMHTSYGDKYLVSRALSKVNDKVKFNKEIMPKEVQFERDYFLQEMFDLFKKGGVRFPLGDYEKFAWLIDHCASMEMKPSLSKFGDPTLHYVKGGTPNDGLMALLNAYLAYKYIVSDGFMNKNPFDQKTDTKQARTLAIGAHVSRRF
jgi:hypothetical protein